MIKAIVYNSYAGHTQKYAEMLSESISLPIFTVDDAKKMLPKGSEIIFLSWVKNSQLTKLSKVNNYFNIKIVGAVGINDYTDDKIIKNFIGSNNIHTSEVFFLRGGIDLTKLTIKGKSQITLAARKLKDYILKRGYNKLEDYEKVDILENGGSLVYKNNLNDLIVDYNNLA